MSSSTIRRLAALVAAITALGASAAAADEYKGTLSAAKPTFTWNGHGVGGPGFECSNEAAFRCDSVLFTIETVGDLSVLVDVAGEQITNPTGAGAYPDFDLYLFRSDPSGAKSGDPVAEAATPSDDETLTARALPIGTYVMEVHSRLSIGEDYAGKAKLSNFARPPAATPPVPPAAATTPAPAAAKPKPSTRARCRAKAKRIKSKRKRAAALRRCNRRK